MPRFSFLAAALACLPATAGFAQAVSECDWRASPEAIVEPWETNSRSFANGNVRLALLDTVEPAAGGFNILVLSPPRDPYLGIRQCRIVSFTPGIGFFWATLEGMEADYDPAVGLIFDIAVEVVVPGTGRHRRGLLHFTLNQATGEIRAVLR